MKMNVSEVQDFVTCPQTWANIWVFGRQPAGDGSEPLRIGTGVHDNLEHLLKGERLVPTPMATLCPEDEGIVTESLDKALGLWVEKYVRTKPVWDEVLAVEESYEVDLSEDITLIGKPDTVVRWRNALWHVQHKTLAQSKPVATYIRTLQRSWHEGLYRLLIKKRFPDYPYGGTMVNLIRKMSRKQMDLNPGQALHLEFLPIGEDRSARALADFMFWAEQVVAWRRKLEEDPTQFVPQNRKSCGGIYGNSLCPFYKVCEGGASLTDDQFFVTRDPLQHYR